MSEKLVAKKEEENGEEIVLKVDMHCEACARKVASALRGFEGVEEVTTDYKASKVVVKGEAADPVKLCQRVQKKCGRRVEIVSPLPKPSPVPLQKEPQENKQKPKEEKKEEPPVVLTVVLQVRMHCEACAQGLQKRIGKVKGVESVTTDVTNNRVTVKGVIDPDKLVTDIYKKTGKQASIVKDEEKKGEEKRDNEMKKEKQNEKKQVDDEKIEDDDTKLDVKKLECPPPKYYMEHAYAPQFFSDDNPNACCVM